MAKKASNERPARKAVKKKDVLNRQIIRIIFAMIFIIFIFLFFYNVFKDNNKIEYQGLVFTKEKFGEIPVFHYYYNFKAPSGNIIKYNLFLRGDPRENNVSVNGEIAFDRGRDVYLAINNTGLVNCPQASLAIGNLVSFINDNQFKVRAGTPNIVESELKNQAYISCKKYPDNFVIEIKKGDSTSISKDNNCYTISVSGCRVLEAVEKFEVQSVLDAKNRV